MKFAAFIITMLVVNIGYAASINCTYCTGECDINATFSKTIDITDDVVSNPDFLLKTYKMVSTSDMNIDLTLELPSEDMAVSVTKSVGSFEVMGRSFLMLSASDGLPKNAQCRYIK